MDNMIELYAVICVILLPLFVVAMIAQMIIFAKAGQAPWKALIPIYSNYVASQIIFGEKYGWCFLIGLVLPGAWDVYEAFMLAKVFGKSTLFAVMNVFFSPITLFIIILSKDKYVGPIAPFFANEK